jgi:hypothetical protein
LLWLGVGVVWVVSLELMSPVHEIRILISGICQNIINS